MLQVVAALQPAVDREDRDLGDVRRRQHLRRREAAGTPRRPRSGSPTSCAATPTRCGRTITSASASTPSTIAAAASCSTPIRSAASPTTPSSTRARRTPTGTRCGTSKTGRFDGGWTVEMQFPFKSLRYTSGADQVWGIQFRRSIRHKNEWTYWTPVPQNMAGPQALNRVSSYGTLVGLDLPPAGPQPRDQAVRARQDVDRSPDQSADLERPRRRHRRRRQVRRHREPHRRPHRQHRLRAGRDRRAAGQPDALQPVPAGEARVLPRGPRPVRLRARRRVAAAAIPAAAAAAATRRTCSTPGASASIAAASCRSTPAAA